jgi:hypothetical protein
MHIHGSNVEEDYPPLRIIYNTISYDTAVVTPVNIVASPELEPQVVVKV